jgi:hypothetical protein
MKACRLVVNNNNTLRPKALLSVRCLSSTARYVVPEACKRQFYERGYTVLKGFVAEEELAFIDEVYGKFMRREVDVPGKDFCDMSKRE